MSRREVVGDSDLYTLTKVSLQDQYFHLSLMTKNKKNIQQRGFASGHPPNY